MLQNLTQILIYSMIACVVTAVSFPYYIRLLRYFKAGKTIREDSGTGDKATIFNALHKHKWWTPTMWGWLILIIMIIMIVLSLLLQKWQVINNSLLSRKETYVLLVAFFGMGIWWLVDDYLNIKSWWRVKWLPAIAKLLWMFLFAGFVSYRFHVKLWINEVNLRPFAWLTNLWWVDFTRFGSEYQLWLWYMALTFIMTLTITNAINITDGLDGLAGGIMLMILSVCAGITFYYGQYIATTVIGIVLWSLLAFLWFNINPAKIFMGDSWSLALGWLFSTLVYLIGIKIGFIIPFFILFGLCLVELLTSGLQILWKKLFKRKLFAIAPLHHLLEHQGMNESSIVMRLWLIQGILCMIAFILVMYQLV